MIDRLRQMAIFAKVINHGSFRGAAHELNLSPSVVSHHISQLEDHLGVALIYRSTRKLSLTREGEKLLAAAHKMMEAVEQDLVELSLSAREPSGELRITAPSVLSLSQLPDKIAAFARRYPRIRLSLDFTDSRKDLIDDGFDLAIRMTPGGVNSTTSRLLFSVQRILVASAEYMATKSHPTHPKQVQNWDWSVLKQVHSKPLKFFGVAGETSAFKPNAQLSTNDAQALFRLTRAGAGVAVVPDFLAEHHLASGDMVHVLPEWTLEAVDVYADWPANAPKRGLIRLLLESLSH